MKRPGPLALLVFHAMAGAIAVSLMRAYPDRHSTLPLAFWTLNVVSVAGPIGALLARHFLPSAAAVALGWTTLLMTLPVVGPRISGGQYGENAMVFIVPMVAGPACLLTAALLRLGWWLWRRHSPPGTAERP